MFSQERYCYLAAKGLIKPVIRHSQQDVIPADCVLKQIYYIVISWIRKLVKKTIIM